MTTLQSSPAVTRLRFVVDENGGLVYIRPAHIKLFKPMPPGQNVSDALNDFAVGVIRRCTRGIKRRRPLATHRKNDLTFRVYGPPVDNLRKGQPVFGIIHKSSRVVGAVLATCVRKHKRSVLQVALGGLLHEVRGHANYRRLLRVVRATYKTPVQSGDKLSPYALRFWKRTGIAVDPTWTFRLNPPGQGLWVYSTDLDWAIPLMNRLATRKRPL